jgi:choline dehydrogenase-like flavoprotein
VLERGGPRKTDEYAADMDELDYSIRFRMMQDLTRETVTLRHAVGERAFPLRQHGAFLPGVGGAGEHWSALSPRFLPDCFELYSRTVEKYGAARLTEDHSIRDWGVTYDELEPHYTRAELLLGVSGKAGNIRGTKIAGDNIFEGWRSAEYPTPATKVPCFSELFRQAANSLGYHPYPVPGATISQLYTNPDGVTRPRLHLLWVLRKLWLYDWSQSTTHQYSSSHHRQAQECFGPHWRHRAADRSGSIAEKRKSARRKVCRCHRSGVLSARRPSLSRFLDS